MKINNLNLVYFSPTGTTRRVIMAVAQKFDLKSVSYDLTTHKAKSPLLRFDKADFVLFGIPVYSGRVPKTVLTYFENLKGNRTPCALIATYGNREYEDALLELKTVVQEKGFLVMGAAAFPAEHSIVRTIGRGRPDKEDFKMIENYGVQLRRKLKHYEPAKHCDLAVSGNPQYRAYNSVPLIPKGVSADCTLCGACKKVCPAGAISADKPYKTDAKKCISCMRCLRVCPVKTRKISAFKYKIAKKKLEKVCQVRKEPEIFI